MSNKKNDDVYLAQTKAIAEAMGRFLKTMNVISREGFSYVQKTEKGREGYAIQREKPKGLVLQSEVEETVARFETLEDAMNSYRCLKEDYDDDPSTVTRESLDDVGGSIFPGADPP